MSTPYPEMLNTTLQLDELIEPVYLTESCGKEVKWDVLRLDKVHPVVSGNKVFKLGKWMKHATEKGYEGILTYGGPYSNHIHATAYATKAAGLSSIGIIRGEKTSPLSPTLQDAERWGMQLIFTDRASFRNHSRSTMNATSKRHPRYLPVPEGGFGMEGRQGAESIHALIPGNAYDWILCACGTGTMMAGLMTAAVAGQKVLGISVLKNNHDLETHIRSLLPEHQATSDILTDHDHHYGGYAKADEAMLSFMNHFHKRTGIPTDIVYTGKLMRATDDLIRKGYFQQGSRILTIHSGGLQGNRSVKEGMLTFF